MQSIKNRVFGNKNKNRELTEQDLIEIHHDFIKCYGWIPIKEFSDLDLPTLWGLHKHVQEDKRKREELRLVLLKYCGIKNPK